MSIISALALLDIQRDGDWMYGGWDSNSERKYLPRRKNVDSPTLEDLEEIKRKELEEKVKKQWKARVKKLEHEKAQAVIRDRRKMKRKACNA